MSWEVLQKSFLGGEIQRENGQYFFFRIVKAELKDNKNNKPNKTGNLVMQNCPRLFHFLFSKYIYK